MARLSDPELSGAEAPADPAGDPRRRLRLDGPLRRLLLQFLYALQNAFARVETFVFATRLNRVTDELRVPAYREALGGLWRGVQDWRGGTRIGESLSRLHRRMARLVDRDGGGHPQ